MKKVRSLFLSDIHLGTRACQAERLLAFLREYESDYLYLVGDIIDLWAMKRTVYWPAAHNTIVQKLLRMARHRTKVFFIPGNHDESLRHYVGMSFGAVDIVTDHVHVTVDGKRLWVMHGDQYDQVTTCHRWISVLGDVSYTALVHLNRLLSLSRRKLGIGGHWSLADYAKRNVLKAVAYIGDFETVAAHAAAHKQMDGVVCGHIHTPAVKCVENVSYYNCGDWVDSCTALVEHTDGRMELVRSTPEHTLAAVIPLLPANVDSAREERLRA
ncbi:MAG TPA: UDP-2,3-diacylglucosamine diphosphatase [Burkholderiales bacterium]|nr:UDP-2,3-diacylglucosamine diphosphatase [Burkholderiales bacterium]